MRIVITGATGKVGSHIARFIDNQHEVRLAARNISKVQEQSEVSHPRAKAIRFDFEDSKTYELALEGADSLFLLRPPTSREIDKALKEVIDAAIAAKVKRIVFLSVLGAEQNQFLPHRSIENYLKQSGMAYTLLRASFFMQNLSTVHREDIRDRNEIFIPAGTGATSFIDARNVAAVAAMALTDSKHDFQAYRLTGAAALDYYEVAGIFTRVLQRAITYPDPSLLEFTFKMLNRQAPLDFILVMTAIYTTVKLGFAKATYPETAELLGRAPTSLQTFVEDYADMF